MRAPMCELNRTSECDQLLADRLCRVVYDLTYTLAARGACVPNGGVRFANESTREAKKSPPEVQEGRDRGGEADKGRRGADRRLRNEHAAFAEIPRLLLVGFLERQRASRPAPAVEQFSFSIDL